MFSFQQEDAYPQDTSRLINLGEDCTMAEMLFTPVPRMLKDLIMEVETGKLGLPELQRGYVWKAKKVRDLLDSMLKGYPIGT
jgi:hypothetical protein